MSALKSPQPGELKVRTRELPPQKLTGYWAERKSTKNPFGTSHVIRTDLESGAQITESYGHPWRGKYPGFDMGGKFITVKSEAVIQPSHMTLVSTDGLTYCEGPLLPSLPLSVTQKGYLKLNKVEIPSDLNALGATAVSLCNPTNPVANASVTLAEAVREGVPLVPGLSLWKDRVKPLLGVSSEFLNAQFGWLPLVDEIREFSKAVKSAADIISQYKRDEGKLVRRQFSFDEIVSPEKVISESKLVSPWWGGQGPAWSRFGVTPQGTLRRYESSIRKSWFKGAFRYYIPDDEFYQVLQHHGSLADKLIGAKLTPEVLWELTPWSWAVDWFSNTQQVVQNLQNFEVYGQFLAYGYMMDESRSIYKHTWEQTNAASTTLHPNVPPAYWESSRKCREHANPFGFGLELNELSSTQWAILAAVGVTQLL